MGQKLDKFLLLMWKNWKLQYRKPIQTIFEILMPLVFTVILVLIRSSSDLEKHDTVVFNPFCTFPVKGYNKVCELAEGTSQIEPSIYNTLYSLLLYSPKSDILDDVLSPYKSAFKDVIGLSNSSELEAYYTLNENDVFVGLQFESSSYQEVIPDNIKLNIRTLYSLLLYSPKSDILDDVLSPYKSAFKDVIGLSNSSELEAYYTLNENDVFVGLQFESSSYQEVIPDNIKLNIRFPAKLQYPNGESNWKTNSLLPPTADGPRQPQYPTGGTPSYYWEGFLALQHSVSVFLAWKKNGVTVGDISNWASVAKENPLPFINMRRFPYASWTSDPLLTALTDMIGFLIVLSFIYTCINTVRAITLEKEKQLKEAMKIMGLPNWLHWTAWFLKAFSFLMITIILMVILLKVRWYSNTGYTVFTYANPFVLIIFLLLYVCATITFCFAVSVFFSKANIATAISGLAWFLSYAPYLFTLQNYDTLSLGTKLAASLGSNAAMAFGFQIILLYEGSGEGVQFSNIWKPSSSEDNLSLGIVMVMLLVDSIIYLLVALYVEAIFPGEYGVPQKWYFPFTSSFWCGDPNYTGAEGNGDLNARDGEYFEAEPTNLYPGIKVRNLRKSFGSKEAVRNLSLNMYEDQITVLLGHNGAGKTTTMSMLTGMFPPSSGTAIINGKDIRTDIAGVRNSLGLCPQHNIIFDELTVAEHLYFFSRLKGMKGREIEAEITKYVDLLELKPKRNDKSRTLSGGMKRKLSVAIALCGNSKVVMLDEPTAGMDPSARRALWDLMLSEKTGRTVLLTTHFMDEADLLGDRIAIMADGDLKCCGSSFFLKKKYGAGYHLIMDKSPKCDSEKVTALLKKHIPNIEVHTNIGSELTYLLAESQSSIFEPMLRDLEQNSEELGINSYGISLTTLEEVFMKVGADHGQIEMYNGNQNNQEIGGNSSVPRTKVSMAAESNSTFHHLFNQIMAMSMKKILSTLRSWILLLIQIALPVIFLITTIAASRAINDDDVENLPALPLSLSRYEDPVILGDGLDLGKDYAKLFKAEARSAYSDEAEKSSINETIIRLTGDTPATVSRRYLGGASFSELALPTSPLDLSQYFDVNFTVYFNGDPYHAAGVSLGLALNAMYKKLVPGCTDNCGIEFVNYPLPYSPDKQVTQQQTVVDLGDILGNNVVLSMAFVSSFYILFIVRERVSKSKHLQFVSGVKVSVFWMVTWFWDFMTYLITIIVFLIILICFQVDGLKTGQEVGILFLLLLTFGWSMLPMIYISGFMFNVPSTGFTRMSLFSIFTGNAAFSIIQLITDLGGNLKRIGHALHSVLLITPHYSLSIGIRDMYKSYTSKKLCTEYCPSPSNCSILYTDRCLDRDYDYLNWEEPGIARNLLYSTLAGAMLFTGLFVAEYKVFSKIICRIKRFSMLPVEVPDEDPDVQAENHKIRNIPEAELVQNYTMVLKDLTKYYKKFLAVNGLSLGVKNYECFGLLGINGAGKTTTFKMLTGDITISYGDAWMNGRSVRREIKEVQKSIGYCPQFDALLDDLTARETLTMYALLRGISRKKCDQVAMKLASDLDYLQHLDKKVKELSGGNKRKLSTSIALIGDPPVIYLDEPTTGMDPGTKRYLWNALGQVRDSGKTIVLTSHSMEECEALCTRLAIMVNGSFKCLGSTQHLKNKFAEGCIITIKVKKPENSSGNMHSDTHEIERFMQESLPGSVLREKHEELLTYYLTDKTVPWSKMFGTLERAKRSNLNIEDYSLGQSSLEQVFLSFTKYQKEID